MHSIVETLDDNAHDVFSASLFAEVIEAREEFELFQQPELVNDVASLLSRKTGAHSLVALRVPTKRSDHLKIPVRQGLFHSIAGKDGMDAWSSDILSSVTSCLDLPFSPSWLVHHETYLIELVETIDHLL